MNIQTVKLQSNGYLVNGSMSVPNSPDNRHYQMVQEWLAKGNTPEPEFTGVELAQQAKQKQIQEAKTYLNSTDWIIVKTNEASVQGADINPLLTKYATELQERQSARDLINELEQSL